MFKAVLVLLLSLLASVSHAYECTQDIDRLSHKYETKILCKIDSFEFMSRNISGQEATDDMLNGVSHSLSKFMETYGGKFAKENITEIVILQNLKFFGSDVGGLSDGEKIYICLGDYSNRDGYRNRIYLRALHHEMSSNVYKKAPFLKRMQWRGITGAYDTSINYLKKCLSDISFSRRTSDELLENGLLVNYSLTSHENDFNVYAEEVFIINNHLLKVKKNMYKKVKLKLNLLKDIYRSVGYIGIFPDET